MQSHNLGLLPFTFLINGVKIPGNFILFYFLRNHHQCIYLRGKGSYLIRNFQLDRTRDTHLPNIWVFTTAQVAISCTGGVTMKPTSI